MINIKGRKSYLVALESVAMTDIIMNLFLFFFISFSLIYTYNPVKLSSIEVNLPSSDNALAPEGRQKAVISVTSGGKYFLDDMEVAVTGLKDLISGRIEEDPELEVLFRVDRSASFDRVALVLDILKGFNINNIDIAMVKDQ